MPPLPGAHRASRFARLASVVALVGAAACSQQPAPQAAGSAADRAKLAAPAAAPAPAAPAPAAEPAGGPAAGTAAAETSTGRLEPPDGVWLKDEDGREYYLYQYPKKGLFNRISDRQVQIQYGLIFEVAKEDEDFFWLKIYRPGAASPPASAGAAAGPSPPVVTQPAATAAPAVGASERLKFVPFDQGLPKRGQWRNGFAIADIDGDGHLDVVHGPARKMANPTPQIFLGDGKGDWHWWDEASFPPLRLDYGDVAVADFNGDGRQDLAFAAHLRGLAVVVAGVDGGFVPWSEGLEYARPEAHEGTASFSSRHIEAVDWNRDGRIDLVAMGEGPGVGRGASDESGYVPGSGGPAVFLNRGDGSWQRANLGAGGERPFGDDLAVGDVDGDGLLDIVTASAGVGRRGILYLGQADGSVRQVEVTAARPQGVVRAVAIADFDGDGRADLALGHASREGGEWRSGIDVLLGREGGVWQRQVVAEQTGASGPWAVAAGDLDADGHTDLVAATEIGEVWVFLGDGKGGFSREAGDGLVPPGRRCTGFHVALADLDGVPGDELVAGFAGESGSEQIFSAAGSAGEKQCSTGGALAAWKAVRR